MSYALGIDLGTTYSAAAAFHNGRAEMVSLGYRSPLMASAVHVGPDGSTLVGEAAVRRGATEPEGLARFFKRRIGDTVPIIVGGSPLSPETLTARLLDAVVDRVIEQQGAPPSSMAITRPANWREFKQDRFEQALQLAHLPAGLSPTVITEPEAAALWYASNERIDSGTVVVVYDLGGGTFDAAVLRRDGNSFTLLGQPQGIDQLGGIDFDTAILAHVQNSLDGALDEIDDGDPAVLGSLARLRDDCVEAKEALTSDTRASIVVALPGLHRTVGITRAEFEAMIRSPLTDSTAALGRAIASAGCEPADVDRLLLVGGSSRIPLVAEILAASFDRPVVVDAHPKHAVALGAAIVAARSQATELNDPGAQSAVAAKPALPTALSISTRDGAGQASVDRWTAAVGATSSDLPDDTARRGDQGSGRRWVRPVIAVGVAALVVSLSAVIGVLALRDNGSTPNAAVTENIPTSETTTSTTAATSSSVPPTNTAQATSGLTAPDPYTFVELNSAHPQRDQTCAGLAGLCIGQPIELSESAFGQTQADGFPQNVVPNEYQVDTRCHRWHPERLSSIDVCEVDGSISRIGLTFSGRPPASLAMPGLFVLRFPDSIADVASQLTTEYRSEPFESQYLFGEGEQIASFSWFLPAAAEGIPDVRISINGRTVEGPANPPSPCDGAHVQFRYDDVLAAATEIEIEHIEVSRVSPADQSTVPCA